MATDVGKQENFIDAIKELLELDYNAVEAYEAAIKNLDKQEYKSKLAEFKDDHKRHIKDLSAFLSNHGEKVTTGPDNIKQYLAVGKLKLSSLFGDAQVLRAMLSNEDDTNTAYERINSRVEETPYVEIGQIISNGLQDERHHKEWLIKTIKKINESE